MIAPKKLVPLPTKAPNLPIPPVGYSQLYVEQLLDVLRLYFNQVDNLSYALLESSFTTAVVALIDGVNASITNNLNNAQYLTKNGTGDYTLTFTQPLSQSTYAPQITLGGIGFAEVVNPQFDLIRFKTYDSTGVATDFSYISLVIIGGGAI
jgi:hypothetical protein